MIEVELYPDDGRAMSRIRELVERARVDVEEVFRAAGYPNAQASLTRVVLFTEFESARARLSELFDVPASAIPETFAGTPFQDTLYLCSEEIVEPTLRSRYPQIPWDGDHEYFEVVKHEIAHMVHERIAIERTGSSEGMGPTWFFEGLAILCARQFPRLADDPGPSLQEVRDLIQRSESESLSYVEYARIAYGLARIASIKELIDAAADGRLEELFARFPGA